MSIKLTLLFSLILIYNFSFSQFNLGFGVGVSGYNGDIPSYNFDENFQLLVKPSISFSIGKTIRKGIETEVAFSWLSLIGDDEIATLSRVKLRNLSFKTNVIEGVFKLNAAPLEILDINNEKFSPYITAGVGFFNFNPKAYYNGTWYELRHLGTEGQYSDRYPDRTPYDNFEFNLTFGIGAVFYRKNNISVAVEFLNRFTRTDYIDDVSKTFVATEDLLNGNGNSPDLAVKLADRSGEIPNNDQIFIAGNARGNSQYNDTYWTCNILLRIPMNNIFSGFGNSNKVICPKF